MTIDPPAIAAGWDIVKRLGPDAAQELLAILELPDEARWAVGVTMFRKQETVTIGEILGASSRTPPGRRGSG